MVLPVLSLIISDALFRVPSWNPRGWHIIIAIQQAIQTFFYSDFRRKERVYKCKPFSLGRQMEFLAESEETWDKNCDSLLIGAAPQHAVFCETKALERIIRALLIACMLEIPQSPYPIVSVIFPFFFSKPGTG